VTPERPRNEKIQNSLVNACVIASLESRPCEVIAISIGVAIANLARASVIGGISVSASLMKMNEAAQVQTMMPANVKEVRVLFVALCLPILYLDFTFPQARFKRLDFLSLLRAN
jgi:hypothetical protein